MSARGRTVVSLIFLAFIAVLGIGLMREKLFSQRAGGAAPAFELTTFEGQVIELEALRGKGVVLNFWASWCDPCRAEAELLEAAWRREEPLGQIVFIGLDYLDQEHAALAYLQEFDVTYPNGPDVQSSIARRYLIKGVPETFFITPDGQISSTIIGPILNEQDLNNRLNDIRPNS